MSKKAARSPENATSRRVNAQLWTARRMANVALLRVFSCAVLRAIKHFAEYVRLKDLCPPAFTEFKREVSKEKCFYHTSYEVGLTGSYLGQSMVVGKQGRSTSYLSAALRIYETFGAQNNTLILIMEM